MRRNDTQGGDPAYDGTPTLVPPALSLAKAFCGDAVANSPSDGPARPGNIKFGNGKALKIEWKAYLASTYRGRAARQS